MAGAFVGTGDGMGMGWEWVCVSSFELAVVEWIGELGWAVPKLRVAGLRHV